MASSYSCSAQPRGLWVWFQCGFVLFFNFIFYCCYQFVFPASSSNFFAQADGGSGLLGSSPGVTLLAALLPHFSESLFLPGPLGDGDPVLSSSGPAGAGRALPLPVLVCSTMSPMSPVGLGGRGCPLTALPVPREGGDAAGEGRSPSLSLALLPRPPSPAPCTPPEPPCPRLGTLVTRDSEGRAIPRGVGASSSCHKHAKSRGLPGAGLSPLSPLVSPVLAGQGQREGPGHRGLSRAGDRLCLGGRTMTESSSPGAG